MTGWNNLAVRKTLKIYDYPSQTARHSLDWVLQPHDLKRASSVNIRRQSMALSWHMTYGMVNHEFCYDSNNYVLSGTLWMRVRTYLYKMSLRGSFPCEYNDHTSICRFCLFATAHSVCFLLGHCCHRIFRFVCSYSSWKAFFETRKCTFKVLCIRLRCFWRQIPNYFYHIPQNYLTGNGTINRMMIVEQTWRT